MTEHTIILTGIWPKRAHGTTTPIGQHREGLTVRCTCMADASGHQVPYAFDYLAQVDTIEQAKYVYAEHLRTGATLVEVPHE